MPHAQRINAARIYSNIGPLVMELQSRLAAHFGVPSECVTMASCGTTV